MTTMDPAAATLLLIDLQARLIPAIDGSTTVIANARRLRDAAVMMEVPLLYTEQNPAKLGATVPEVASNAAPVVRKMTFDATASADFPALPEKRTQVIVAGVEAHVCVLQTALSLIHGELDVFVVRDAVGSRRIESRDAALARLEHHGVEIVTTEMVVFEWLRTAGHPRFRELSALIR
jgi:isochorismate hydrolase